MSITNYSELEELALSEGHRGIEGVPSCSRLPQMNLCPGSMWAIVSAKTKSNDGGSAADKGTVIHKAMEIEFMPSDAPVDYLEPYNWMQDKLSGLKEIGWEHWISEDYFELVHELQPILTGAVDRVLCRRDAQGQVIEVMVIDFKTGRNKVNSDSVQLKAYCLMIEQFKRKEIHNECKWFTYAMQPAHPNNRFTEIDIDDAHDLVYGILDRSEYGTGGERIPGNKQCKYCNAHNTTTCPETMTVAANLAEAGEI